MLQLQQNTTSQFIDNRNSFTASIMEAQGQRLSTVGSWGLFLGRLVEAAFLFFHAERELASFLSLL